MRRDFRPPGAAYGSYSPKAAVLSQLVPFRVGTNSYFFTTHTQRTPNLMSVTNLHARVEL